ncbi:MAG: hypothetical protein IJ083_15140 [Clostridia bacterium]|nr:hypothetical protein [Clostridia bacterium]
MPTLIERVVKGHSYWSISTSKRGPGGKPQEVVLEYIGSTKKLGEWVVARMHVDPTKPAQSRDAECKQAVEDFLRSTVSESFLHGLPVAMFRIAESMHMAEVLDSVFPPKTICGMTRGQVLTLTAAYQAVGPGRISGFGQWVGSTTLPMYLDQPAEELTSQAIWEAMDGIAGEMMHAAWKVILKRLTKLHPGIRRDLLETGRQNSFHNDPRHAWTDEKMCVHIFLCLVGVIMKEELCMFVREHGCPEYNLAQILKALAQIREVWMFRVSSDTLSGQRIPLMRTLEPMDAEQARLWDAVMEIPASTASANAAGKIFRENLKETSYGQD